MREQFDNDVKESKTLERIATFLALLVFISSAYLVWDEQLFNSIFGEKSSGKPIAVITDSKNNIRRKGEEQLAWYSVQKDGEIFQKDLIFAGKDSEATIEFKDGNKLKISPNTLVTLDSNNNQIELSLKYGTFRGQIEKDKTLQVTINGKKRVIRGNQNSEIVIQKGETGTQIQVVSGTIDVDKTKVEKAQKVEVDQTGELDQVIPVEFELAFPQNGEEFWKRRRSPIRLSWTVVQQRQYRVEVAKDPDFENIEVSRMVQDAEETQVAFTNPGTYYWRVVAIAGRQQKTTPSNSFSIKIEKPVQLITPQPQEEFLVKAEKNAQLGTFEWPERELVFTFEDRTGAENYTVEISESLDFKQNTIREVVTSQRLSDVFLPQGKYFWRVKINDPNRPEALWSQVGEFSILRENTELETPQILLTQATSYQIPLLQYADWTYQASKNPRSFARVSEYLVDFLPKQNFLVPELRFQNVFAAQSYEFEVRSLTSGRIDAKIRTQPRFVLDDLSPGAYQVRGRARSRTNSPSSWSSRSQFRISLAPPISTIQEEFTSTRSTEEPEPKTINIAWRRTLFTQAYEIQISRSSRFTAARSYVRPVNRISVSVLPDQNYYWRVRSLGRNRRPLSRFSNISRLRLNENYVPIPTLAVRPEVSEKTPDEELVETIEVERPQTTADLGATGQLNRNRAPRFFSWELERRDPGKKPNYWAWAGTGLNYQSFANSTGQQDVNVAGIGGPTVSLNAGASTGTWGVDASFKNRSGTLEPDNGVTVDPNEFNWRTFVLEGLYSLKGLVKIFGIETESRIRAGVQHNNLPIVADNGANNVVLVDTSVTSASVGADLTIGRKRRLRYQLFMRYQLPISGADSSGTFQVTPTLGLDGGVGVVYRMTPTSYLGVNIGAHLQNYNYSLNNNGTVTEGDQSLLFSNLDTHIGFEF